MDKQNVKKFKNCQKRLAKKIAKTLGSNNFTIDYEQIIPSACIDRETGKVIVRNNTQYIFPTKTIRKGRNKLIVVMRFNGICKSRTIGKILKRYEVINPQRITTNTFLKTVHSPSVYAKDLFHIELDGQTRVYGDNVFATFAPEYFSPKHYMTGRVKITEHTIAYHHYASTWHTRSEHLRNHLSRTGYRLLGAKNYAQLEKQFNKSLERQIRKELP